MPVFANMMQGPSAAVKSVQRFSITISAGAASGTATISAVVLAKSALIFDGFKGGATITSGSTSTRGIFPALDLTNTTTVTASVDTTAAGTLIVTGTVVEYY